MWNLLYVHKCSNTHTLSLIHTYMSPVMLKRYCMILYGTETGTAERGCFDTTVRAADTEKILVGRCAAMHLWFHAMCMFVYMYVWLSTDNLKVHVWLAGWHMRVVSLCSIRTCAPGEMAFTWRILFLAWHECMCTYLSVWVCQLHVNIFVILGSMDVLSVCMYVCRIYKSLNVWVYMIVMEVIRLWW